MVQARRQFFPVRIAHERPAEHLSKYAGTCSSRYRGSRGREVRLASNRVVPREFTASRIRGAVFAYLIDQIGVGKHV